MSIVRTFARWLRSKVAMHSYKCLFFAVICALVYVVSVHGSGDAKKGPKVTDKVSG